MFVRYKKKDGRSIPIAKVYTKEEHPVRNSQIDPDVLSVIKTMKRSGAEAYIVGGAVRDLVLSKKPKDFDIATSLTPSQVKRMFFNSRIIGKRFRIVHLFFSGGKIVEVTTFRRDDELFENGKNNLWGSAEQDAKRRDFTINALYFDTANEEIIDFSTSMDDIKRGIIRSGISLSYSFSEDPVRMVRAVKYSVLTGFRMKADIKISIRSNKGHIQRVPISRLTEEVEKVLCSAKALDIFLELRKYSLLQFIFPCLGEYIKYSAVREGLKKLDLYVEERNKENLDRGVLWSFIMEPLLVLEGNSAEEIYLQLFRQAKVIVNPLTPANFELEKAVEKVMENWGIKRKKRVVRKNIKKAPSGKAVDVAQRAKTHRRF